MAAPRRRVALVLVVALACLTAAGLAAQSGSGSGTAGGGAAGAASTTARLLKGPERVKGLPFFGPNAISALSGEYDAGGASVRVWSCREAVWLSPEWKPLPPGFDTASKVFALPRGQGVVLALVARDYRLFVELPEDSPALRRFASSLDRRFLVFFQNAKTDAELSFPAYVDFKM